MAEKGDQGRGGAGLQGRAAPWFHVGSGWRDVLAAAQGRGFPFEEKVGEEDCLPVSKGESCLFRNSFIKGCPDSSVGEEFTCNAGDPGLIPGSGRAPGEGIGYPLQYSGLENSMDRGAWQTTVHGVAKSRTQLSNFHFLQTS